MTPQTSIQFLKGVGEARSKLYEKLGIFSIKDLLYHFPRDYIDISKPCLISQAPVLVSCAICATLSYKSSAQRIRKGLEIFKLIAFDDSGEISVTIFNAKYLVNSLTIDTEYIFYGKISGHSAKREMLSPMIFPANSGHTVLPVYPQTSGIKSTLMRKNIQQALESIGELTDSLPESLRLEYNLVEFNIALHNIHFPDSLETANRARERFVFEELFVLCCALFKLSSTQLCKSALPMSKVDLSPFFEALPFSPTNSQKNCIDEIAADFQRSIPMNRLLQGDVGSGKTMVAASAIYISISNGFQCALMAPTEILAEQHYRSFCDMLNSFGISIALLTASTKTNERLKILHGLSTGTIDICIGTHALLSNDVEYNNLGLVITDEQHRFGVNQRAALSKKADNCHVLVMSATPIPRTLSLIIYGDLQLSIIDELPPGRQPIETLLISSSKRSRALAFIRDMLDAGRQAYIVCPLIETGEVDLGLQPAVEYAAQLSENEFSNYTVGLLHGRMKSREKEDVMSRFKSGEIQLLVSTTVVEVGVDVPNATVILIENSDRFGLSQLHQLRGRIGRGIHKSWCILVSDARGDVARERLSAMKKISDGFLLAELDLKLRGPGDFLGERQHGLPMLKVASLADNVDVLQKAKECAADLLKIDSLLSMPQHKFLHDSVEQMLGAIGNRPN